MESAFIPEELLSTLTECYESDPRNFVTLPKQSVDLSSVRIAIAELRNEGSVEEQKRGVIRFTTRGYKIHRKRNYAIPRESKIQFAV